MKAKNDPQTCPHTNVKHFKNCVPPRTWCQDCGIRVDAAAVALRAESPAPAPEAPAVKPPVVQPEPPSQDIDDALRSLEQEVKAEDTPGSDDGVFSGLRKRLTGEKKSKKSEKKSDE